MKKKEKEKPDNEIGKNINKEQGLGTLKAKDIMTTEVLSIEPQATIRDALLIFKKNNLTELPVVEKGGKIVGMISDYDILMSVSQKNLDDKIEFNKDLISVVSDTPLKDVLVSFVRFKVGKIPVVDAFSKFIGMINRNEFIFKIMEVKMKEEKKSEAA